MVECMLEVRNQTLDEHCRTYANVSEIVSLILNTKDSVTNCMTTNNTKSSELDVIETKTSENSELTIEQYLVWTVKNALAIEFSRFIHQICHVVYFGQKINKLSVPKMLRNSRNE